MEGTSYKQYVFEQKLGEGGMADVYLAKDTQLNHYVAIKRLKVEFVYSPNIRNRFISEAKSMFQMNHTNVTKVFGLIEDGDFVAAVMEFVPGQTLEEYRNRRKSLDYETIKVYLNQIIEALNYVHGQGLIHRDIKPANFIVNSDLQLKLLDFGIAKNMNQSNVQYTSTGISQQMGTPLYMSPEQIKTPNKITEMTDVYSLGVVLYFLVTGKSPYDQDLNLFDLQSKIVNEKLPLTNTAWDSIIQKATNKIETERYQTVIQIKKDILDIDPNKTIVDTKVGSSKVGDIASRKSVLGQVSKKHKLVGLISILILIVGFVIFGFIGETEEEQKKNAEKVVTSFVKDLDLDIRNTDVYPNVDNIKGSIYYLRDFDITSTTLEDNGEITVYVDYDRSGTPSNAKFIVRKIGESYKIIKSIGISAYFETPLMKYCLRNGYIKNDNSVDQKIDRICSRYESEFNNLVQFVIDEVEENVVMDKRTSNLEKTYGNFASGNVTLVNNTMYSIPGFAIDCRVKLMNANYEDVLEEKFIVNTTLEPYDKLSKYISFSYVPNGNMTYYISTKVSSREAIETFVSENF